MGRKGWEPAGLEKAVVDEFTPLISRSSCTNPVRSRT